MQIYRITFIKNKADLCKIVNDTIKEGDITYEQYKGFLIYALVRAEDDAEARKKATELLEKFMHEKEQR
jgi:hypothetical protein